MKKKQFFIYGIGQQAQLSRYYIETFLEESIDGFIIDMDTSVSEFDGRILLNINDFFKYYSPQNTKIFIAIGGIALNAIRTYYYELFLKNGYSFANCIDNKIFIPNNSSIGLNAYIVENSIINPFVSIGNNFSCTNSLIGHHSVIKDNVTIIGSQLAGNVTIQESVFIGGNCFIEHGVTIGKYSLISSGSIVKKNVSPFSVISTNPSKLRKIDPLRVKILGTSFKQFNDLKKNDL